MTTHRKKQKQFSHLSLDAQNKFRAASKAFNSGQHRVAHEHCMGLVRHYPKFASGWDLASRSAFALSAYPKALEHATRALTLEPDNPDYLTQKAYCLLAVGQKQASYELVQKAARMTGNDPPLLDKLGNLYNLFGKQSLAQTCFERAIKGNPRNAHYHFNLATMKQALGDFEGAEQAFTHAIKYNPDDAEASLNRSRLRKQTREINHIEELESKAQSWSGPWMGRAQLHYALAKEYEDIKAYENSFRNLKLGADLRRSNMQYKVQHETNTIEKILEHFSCEFFDKKSPGFGSSEPIFIVGLPRSGTTLVERIVGSHNAVFLAGELNNFASLLVAQVNEQFKEDPNKATKIVELSTRVDYERLGRNYIESTRPQTEHTDYFVDKLPLNYLYCGLIHRALPKAKIIHLTRQPMDACYAMYKTLFTRAYPFSYDLIDLGQYYCAYRKLMDHWHRVLPGKILDVSYERLVHDQEGVSRKIFEFCGLEWEKASLEFYKNDSPSMTASLAQIRQPVYSSSVGLWQNYAEQLAPLQKALTDSGFHEASVVS